MKHFFKEKGRERQREGEKERERERERERKRERERDIYIYIQKTDTIQQIFLLWRGLYLEGSLGSTALFFPV